MPTATRSVVAAIALLLGTLALGCPPQGEKKDDKKGPCSRVGETCEFAPGKLGTCVAKDGCTEASPTCFVCQSQH